MTNPSYRRPRPAHQPDRRLAVALLASAAIAAAALAATAQQASEAAVAEPLTIERIFAAPDLSGTVLRNPRFSPDGRLVTYLQGRPDDKDRLDLWAWDVAAGRSLRLVDSTQITAGAQRGSVAAGPPEAGKAVVNNEEEQRRERQRTSSLSGIVDYVFSPDSRRLLFPIDGDLFLYDRDAPAAQAVRRLTDTAAYETDPKFSPQGRYVSFVRDQNLWVIELASGREQAVTRDGQGTVSCGTAEFVAQEEMDRSTGYWWSPDETRIAFTRVDEAPVDLLERFEILADSVRVVQQRYPAAGRPNADVRLYVATLPGRDPRKPAAADEPPVAPIRIDTGEPADGYLARVDWFPDSMALALQWQSRDQRQLILRRADPATGRSQELLREHSDSWVSLHDELTFLPRRRAFLWASERSGQRHLYLYDYRGQLLRPVTAGDWMVTGDGGERAIEAVDERSGRVWFTANRESPLERHLYVAPLEGPRDPAAIEAGIRQLSSGAGWHSVTMAPDGSRWLDLFSDPDTPPSLTLRRSDGRALATLVSNRLDAAHPYAPFRSAQRPTEFGTLQAADGQTLHWQMLRPPGMQAGRRYPVIVDVYGGPGFQRVKRAWGGFPRSNEGFFRQYLARQGYVVFTLDNRGSGFRGTAFESAVHRQLGQREIDDQVRGVEYLRSLPFVDPARVGIFGWSYGGYMALLAMLRAPQHFAAGVAGAPVTDWSLYDTHYTERYLGTPQDNAAGYREASVLTHADGLQGPLLVMHGMADDNVLFTHSTALFKRLQDLGKPFDVMPYPGSKHGLLRFQGTGPHAYHSIARFFDRHLRAAQSPPWAAKDVSPETAAPTR
ncbi:MAG: DPP IV N-terminal domain-containing protein [Sinobacteraceae bacterium]|nr:DPP IV N-terminal domain-containing protein [Nevskiaceae bacterium]